MKLCSSQYRANFTFEATDGTETMKFTVFNDHVEQLFGLKCEEIIKLKNDVSFQLHNHLCRVFFFNKQKRKTALILYNPL